MTEQHDALCKAITTYLHANDYRPGYFALQLTKAPDSADAQLLRTGLKDAMRQSTLSPETFGDLTDALVDTQDEVDAYLASLWAYVFEDGPEPVFP